MIIKSFGWSALLSACGFQLLLALPVQAQGVAQALCQSHGAYLQNAFQMQRQQLPLDIALRMVSRV